MGVIDLLCLSVSPGLGELASPNIRMGSPEIVILDPRLTLVKVSDRAGLRSEGLF